MAKIAFVASRADQPRLNALKDTLRYQGHEIIETVTNQALTNILCQREADLLIIFAIGHEYRNPLAKVGAGKLPMVVYIYTSRLGQKGQLPGIQYQKNTLSPRQLSALVEEMLDPCPDPRRAAA